MSGSGIIATGPEFASAIELARTVSQCVSWASEIIYSPFDPHGNQTRQFAGSLVCRERFLKKFDIAAEVAVHFRRTKGWFNPLSEACNLRRRVDSVWNTPLGA